MYRRTETQSELRCARATRYAKTLS